MTFELFRVVRSGLVFWSGVALKNGLQALQRNPPPEVSEIVRFCLLVRLDNFGVPCYYWHL